MSVKHLILILALVALGMCSQARAADKPAETATTAAADKVDKNSVAATSSTAASSNDYGIPHNMMQIITNGGAVALGVAVVAALAALAMPMFGIKMCQILGNCDNYAMASTGSGYAANSVYQNDVYGQYPQASYPSSNTYQKRSVDYMGPVLHMLKTAYDKYGQSTLANSQRTS